MLKYALAILAALALGMGASHTITKGDGKARITEDDPRWNCKTMGNKVCGYELSPNGRWVTEVTDKGRMVCWETRKHGNVYLNFCRR